MKRTCVQCGKEFELTNSEVDFYKKKNLSLPKRCQACREKNKQQNGKTQMRQPSPAAGSRPASGSPSAGGKGIMTIIAGIMLLLVVFFFLRQTGILSDVKDNPSTVAGLQTAGPTPEGTVTSPPEEMTTPSSELAAGDVQTEQPSASPEAAVTNPPEEVTTPSPEPTAEETPVSGPAGDTQPAESPASDDTVYTFRSEKLLLDHYKKHGIDMGFDSAEAYAAAANEVIHNPDALHKLEAEDGDDIYYLEETNEFVVVSTDGYIRTYFNPDKGIDYYNRQ